MLQKLNIGIIGLGRIGRIHLKNLQHHPSIGAIFLCDGRNSSFQSRDYPIFKTAKELIQDARPDIVFICSPTPSHFDLIKLCAHHKIDVFCEKPVDLNLNKIKELSRIVQTSGIKLQVGFNRRFDPDFIQLKTKIDADLIGDVHQITIISRDPGLPSMEYLKSSGGMFMDMTIHDFDMARFLANSEVLTVYSNGQARVDQRLTEIGDIDTATSILLFENGITCTILNSRESTYGYDQRIEVFGSKGLLSVKNHLIDRVNFSDINGSLEAKPLPFFLERYARSYEAESQDFIAAVLHNRECSVTINDALKATEIAVYANKSLSSGQVEKLN